MSQPNYRATLLKAYGTVLLATFCAGVLAAIAVCPVFLILRPPTYNYVFWQEATSKAFMFDRVPGPRNGYAPREMEIVAAAFASVGAFLTLFGMREPLMSGREGKAAWIRHIMAWLPVVAVASGLLTFGLFQVMTIPKPKVAYTKEQWSEKANSRTKVAERHGPPASNADGSIAGVAFDEPIYREQGTRAETEQGLIGLLGLIFVQWYLWHILLWRPAGRSLDPYTNPGNGSPAMGEPSPKV